MLATRRAVAFRGAPERKYGRRARTSSAGARSVVALSRGFVDRPRILGVTSGDRGHSPACAPQLDSFPAVVHFQFQRLRGVGALVIAAIAFVSAAITFPH